jgi:hypothetical protein
MPLYCANVTPLRQRSFLLTGFLGVFLLTGSFVSTANAQFPLSVSSEYESLQPRIEQDFGASPMHEPNGIRPHFENNEQFFDSFAIDPPPRPQVFRPKVKADAGAAFLWSQWDNESFQSIVPAGAESDFGFLSAESIDDFEYDPSLQLKVEVKTPPVYGNNGLGYEGYVLTMKGSADKNYPTSVGTPSLHTDSSIILGILGIDFVDAVYPLTWDPRQKSAGIEDQGFVDVSVGVRYLDVSENYNSILLSGSNSSKLSAVDNFKGFGAGIGAQVMYPMFRLGSFLVQKDPASPVLRVARWNLVCNFEGNFGVGKNDRTSSLTVLTETPGLSGTSKLQLIRTEIVSIGSIETGVVWNYSSKDEMTQTTPGKQLWSVSALFVGHVLGNIGFIDPRDLSLEKNNQFLYGILVAGGMQF